MMIGMSGLGVWMGFGVLFVYACDIRMGREGYWFKVFLCRRLEAMTDGVCTESYGTFSYMGRIIKRFFIQLGFEEVGCWLQPYD